MTLNATDRILYQVTQTNRLVMRYPLRSMGENKRLLYVTPEVASGLDGKDDALKHLPMVEMETTIAQYCAGWAVTVSLIGDPEGKRPRIERLKDLDEVWVFCARKPRGDQVRMFGRFLDAGKFVALALHDRGFLGRASHYNTVAATIPKVWNNLFSSVQPLRASAASEYLRGNVRDVDET